MKTIQIKDPGPASAVLMEDQPEPRLASGEVLVRVRAAGVNRADLLQRAGKYPPPPGASDILGLEVSGVIESVAVDVSEWRVGDEVCALLAGGGYAEKVAVPAGQIMRKPHGISLRDAAAIPEAFVTAYTNLVFEGGLSRGEKVLIHGGSSGVGTAAIQIARSCGAEVACTVGDDSKFSRCRELGASAVFNYKAGPFADGVLKWSPDGVDMVLDIIGKEYLDQNMSVLARKGRLICIATMSGSRAEVDLALLMRKRLRIVGSVLRSRSVAEKSDLVSDFAQSFLPLLDSGVLKPVVHATFSFSEVAKAHDLMRSSAHVGKILLEWT